MHKNAVAVSNVKAGLISHPQFWTPLLFHLVISSCWCKFPPVFKGFATNPPQVGTSILKLASHSNPGTYSISFEDLKHAGEIHPCTTMRSPSCKVTFRLLWSDGTVMHYWSIFEKANSYLVVGIVVQLSSGLNVSLFEGDWSLQIYWKSSGPSLAGGWGRAGVIHPGFTRKLFRHQPLAIILQPQPPWRVNDLWVKYIWVLTFFASQHRLAKISNRETQSPIRRRNAWWNGPACDKNGQRDAYS